RRHGLHGGDHAEQPAAAPAVLLGHTQSQQALIDHGLPHGVGEGASTSAVQPVLAVVLLGDAARGLVHRLSQLAVLAAQQIRCTHVETSSVTSRAAALAASTT